MAAIPFYAQIIQDQFDRKRKANPAYSLRAFGRDIGIHPSTLSQVLKGARPLPIKLNAPLIKKFKLDPKEATLFQESVIRRQALLDQIKIPAVERFMLDESHYKVIAEWEHYAILSLMHVPDFVSDIKWIAKRLGISENRAEEVLGNLLASNMIELRNGEYKKLHNRFRTTEDIKSTALISSHLETLELAKKKLTEVELERRDYSSSTIAMDSSLIPEFKAIIREFREKAAIQAQKGTPDEVYQFSIQFFPLTEKV